MILHPFINYLVEIGINCFVSPKNYKLEEIERREEQRQKLNVIMPVVSVFI